ncbi:MAG: hypothetical protein ACON5B_09555 [Myxococcota bacterium]
MKRPSQIITLVVSSLSLQGCLFGCPPEPYTDQTDELTLEMAKDESGVLFRNDVIAFDDAEGCAEICTDELSAYNTFVEDVTSCTIDADEKSQADLNSDLEAGVPTATVTCVTSGTFQCIGGRHSEVLAERATGQGATATGAWLAREAVGEAGSVHAFEHLRRELEALGAPMKLIAAAAAARDDEVRHARMMTAFATKHHGQVTMPRVQDLPLRGLFELAMEIAGAGCVHETWAAARVAWQATHATDATMRKICTVLARDEARHADLAAAIHAWALSQLPDPQGRQIEAARQDAWARLATHDAEQINDDALGLPRQSQQSQLIAALQNAFSA